MVAFCPEMLRSFDLEISGVYIDWYFWGSHDFANCQPTSSFRMPDLGSGMGFFQELFCNSKVSIVAWGETSTSAVMQGPSTAPHCEVKLKFTNRAPASPAVSRWNHWTCGDSRHGDVNGMGSDEQGGASAIH